MYKKKQTGLLNLVTVYVASSCNTDAQMLFDRILS